jgi:membrane-associated phospholipid phosphatase
MILLNSIVLFDTNIQNIIFSFRSDFWNNFFFFITKFGDWSVIGILFVCFSIWLFFIKKNRLILPFLITLGGSAVVTLLIKFLVDRQRPTSDNALYLETLPSFPSAHSALVMALFGFIVCVVCRLNIKLILKIILSFVFVLLIAVVGFSRIYLGVHFASDVIGGYLTGLVCLLVVRYILRNRF